MTQEFDPYHRWLGIPPEEQPASHYRLLGLVPLEDDVEVIRDAAERQIGHVRRYGLGKHSELSQRILNELAGAKACLMDPEKKSRYDAELRIKLKASKSKPEPASRLEVPDVPRPAPSPPPALRTPPELPGGVGRFPPVETAEGPGIPASGRSTFNLVALGGGAAVGLLLVVSLVVYLVWPGTRDREGHATPKALTPAQAATPATAAQQPVAVPAKPTPPKLARIGDQTVDEGQTLVVKVEVADRGTAPGRLLFKFPDRPPQGAVIDAETGVFRWTPSREQAGVKHPVTVKVSALEAPDLADSITFLVSVEEARLLPPRIQAIPEQQVEAGARGEFVVRASDRNDPPRKLRYALQDSPSWARIDRTSGAVTLEPPDDDQGGTHRMLVRVASDVPDAPFVEWPFTVVVTPRQKPSSDMSTEPAQVADLSGLAKIAGLSGPLNPAQLDAWQAALASAQGLMDRADADPKVMPLFAGSMGGPVAAVCELNRSNKLDGVVVTFPQGKDPMSCLDAKTRSILAAMPRMMTRPLTPSGVNPGAAPGMVPQMPGTVPAGQGGGVAGMPADDSGMNAAPSGMTTGVSPMQLAAARTQALQTFWADVRLESCLSFKQGDRHGVVALWDAEGRRTFWGNYQRGKRHDFCCLFENDQPRIVVVFDQGERQSVYLIAKGNVQKRFADEKEAQNDAVAGTLLTKLDGIESLLVEGERKLEKQIKATIQFRVGNLRQYKNMMAQMRMAGRAARQMQGVQDSQRRAFGGP